MAANNFGELVLILGDLHIPQRAHAIPQKFKKMLVPGKMQHLLCTGNLTTPEVRGYLTGLAPKCIFVRGEFDDFDGSEDKKSGSKSGGGGGGWPIAPDTAVVEISTLKIGVINTVTTTIPYNDLDALSVTARIMQVDILVVGGTHRSCVVEKGGVWFIFPGSITGAFSPLGCKGLTGVVQTKSASTSTATDSEAGVENVAATEPEMGEDGGVVKPSFVLLSVTGGKVVCYCYEFNEGKDAVEVSKTEFSK